MLKAAVTIFLLLNPIGTLPIFIALTGGSDARARRNTAFAAAFAASLVLLAFIWSGAWLVDFFGLSIPAFAIGGGIILFRIGMEMLNCSVDLERALKHVPESLTRRSSAVVPLGIPLLAGPGSIALVMTLTVGGHAGPENVSCAMLGAMASSVVVWLGGSHLLERINIKSAAELLTRLGGLFLVVLAVQMIINGYRAVRG